MTVHDESVAATNRDIRAFLGRSRPSLPPAMRLAMWIGIAMVAAYAALLVLFYFTNKALYYDAFQLYGLTLVAGREAAMLAAYTPPTPVPLAWMLVLGPLTDLAHFFFALVFVWYLFAVLARVPGPDRFLGGLEKTALRQRKWTRRWGLAGLALFYWLPGFGTGAFAICAIGVMARIPLTRLIPVLGASALFVSLSWALILGGVAQFIPTEGWWTNIPFAVIAVVMILALYSTIGQWRTSHQLLLGWPVPDRLWNASLAGLGMQRRGDCLEIDARVLGAAANIPWQRTRRIRSMAELLLMPGMDLENAKRLEKRGVTGIEAIAQLPTASLIGAVEDADPEGRIDGPKMVPTWQDEARLMEKAAGEAWRGPARD